MEGFELFDNQSINRVVNKITITKNYSINFPTAFCRINGVGDKKTALLYFNREKFQIAIEFKEGVDERGFKITNSNGGRYGGYITTKNFFTMNGLIGNVKVGRYDYRKISEQHNGLDNKELYVLQLESNN